MSPPGRLIGGAVGLGHGVAPEDGNRLVVNPEGTLGLADLHLSGRADRCMALWLLCIEYTDLQGDVAEPMNRCHQRTGHAGAAYVQIDCPSAGRLQLAFKGIEIIESLPGNDIVGGKDHYGYIGA